MRVDNSDTATGAPGARPDAFISHSSHDKNRFVRPLVECLTEHGVGVWYDEYSLRPGDSLSASIDRGLVAARFGIVIISPAFIETALQSGWTHYELRGIVSNSIGAPDRRIVPVWLDVTADDVRRWSPSLADLVAIRADMSIGGIALEIVQAIAPSKAEGLQRQRFVEVAARTGKQGPAKLSELRPSPPRERRVSGNVPLRALLVTEALAECDEAYASDLDTFLENLSRDLHHERELRVMEAIAGSYLRACRQSNLDQIERNALFRVLVAATLDQVDEPASQALRAEVVGRAVEHLDLLLTIAQCEAVIGEGGLRGVLVERYTNRPADPFDDAGDPGD